MELDKALDRFHDYLKYVRNMSRNTIEAYSRDLEHFKSFLQNHSLDFKAIKRNNIESFMKSLSQAKPGESRLSASSIARNLSSVKAFYLFLFLSGEVQSMPTDLVKAPKLRRRIPEYIPYEDVQKLVNSFSDSHVGKRNKAIVAVLYFGGLRVSEACSLQLSDVPLGDEPYIRVRGGKGGKDRIVPLNGRAAAILDDYVGIRGQFANSDESNALFLGTRGEPISRKMIPKMLNTQAKVVLPNIHVHPHVFRHSFATHLIQRGVNVKIVQELLGHANLATTSIYLHIADREKRAAVEALYTSVD